MDPEVKPFRETKSDLASLEPTFQGFHTLPPYVKSTSLCMIRKECWFTNVCTKEEDKEHGFVNIYNHFPFYRRKVINVGDPGFPNRIVAYGYSSALMSARNGLFIVRDEYPSKVEKLLDGNFIDAHVAENKITALEMKLEGDCSGKVHAVDRPTLENKVVLFSVKDLGACSVLHIKDHIYLAFCEFGKGAYVRSYQKDGTVLNHFRIGNERNLKGFDVKFCGYDQNGNIMLADRRVGKVKVLDSNGHCKEMTFRRKFRGRFEDLYNIKDVFIQDKVILVLEEDIIGRYIVHIFEFINKA